jgi:hypothetical protein
MSYSSVYYWLQRKRNITPPTLRFTPDVLGMTSTTALFIILAEVLITKLGLYILAIPADVPVLDLIAYSGYKFVGYNPFINYKNHRYTISENFSTVFLVCFYRLWLLHDMFRILLGIILLIDP